MTRAGAWSLVMLIPAPSLAAVPLKLAADFDYDFRDDDGTGWVLSKGTSTLTITLGKETGSLRIAGQTRSTDALLTSPGDKLPPGTPYDIKASPAEYKYDHSYELAEVVRREGSISFRFALNGDTIIARCVPVKLPELARTDLFECSFSGFKWRAGPPELPELRHSVVVSSAVPRILNTLSGKAKTASSHRTVTERN